MVVVMLARPYFLFSRFFERVRYALGPASSRTIVVLTFDDEVTNETLGVPTFLAERGIRATFFVPAETTSRAILSSLVRMGHELGGHSLRHDRSEREHQYVSARRCRDILKRFDPRVRSWRFPWTSRDAQSVANVRAAGFMIDSSRGALYPAKKLGRLGGLDEIPWIRLPRTWQMDINESDYGIVRRYVLAHVAKHRGVHVLGLHTYYQHRHLAEFKDFIETLRERNIEFMTLREAHRVLAHGKL